MITIIFSGTGFTDMLARASLCLDVLGKKNLQVSKIIVTSEFLRRNNINLEFLSKFIGLGFNFNLEEKNRKDISHTVKLTDLNEFNMSDDEINIDLIDEGLYKKYPSKHGFDRYNDQLFDSLRNGNFLKQSNDDVIPDTMYVHYRLGDCALVPGRIISEILNISAQEYFLIGNRLFETSVLTGEDFIPSCYINRICLPQQYSNFINSYARHYNVTIGSDGFDRCARTIKNRFPTKYSWQEISVRLTKHMFADNFNGVKNLIIGEKQQQFKQILFQCMTSSHWQRGPSLFPFDFITKCGYAPKFLPYPIKSVTYLDIQNYLMKA